jgi:hypothetical protein
MRKYAEINVHMREATDRKEKDLRILFFDTDYKTI